MDYVIDPDFFVEFGSNGFYEVNYLGFTCNWVLERFFWHFRFRGLGFGVTSGLGLGALILPFLGLLSQSRVIWVISGSQGLYGGVFWHFRKFVCLGSLGVGGRRS